MTSSSIYSIGHSDHDIEAFTALLDRFGIDILVDVRSQPYSRWVPHFNRESLQKAVVAASLRYVWLGETLGGRPPNDALYDGDSVRPNYERMRTTADYLAGIDDLLTLLKQGTVAMMCSEGDYRTCHRTLLITPTLLDREIGVIHVLPNGRTVEATESPEQLSLF